MLREVALKERLIDRDILQPENPLAAFELDDTVDQQEWIAVWYVLEDLADIEDWKA
jgi:hypothetical protein